MQRLVVRLADSKFYLEDCPDPVIGQNPYAPYDIIAEVKFAGICGTELYLWKHGFPKGVLKVEKLGMGHEFSGVVKEIGEKVTQVKVGDRIVAEVSIDYCGKCILCVSGFPTLCKKVSAFMLHSGAFAKYLPLPEKIVRKIPDNISLEEAALCQPLGLAVNSVQIKGKLRAGESVTILGPGPIGLLCLQIAKKSGAYPLMITGLSRDKKRLAVASQLGADFTLNSEEEDVIKKSLAITRGEGFDLVIEIAGAAEAVRQALEIVRPGGRVVLTGSGYEPLQIDAARKIMMRGVDVLGCRAEPPLTWTIGLKLLESGLIDCRSLISDILPLKEWEEGFKRASQSDALKILLVP
jgi:2-desacetyl-2-hydroxyethyl bacteriochlorophyllide A dehydrogenase